MDVKESVLLLHTHSLRRSKVYKFSILCKCFRKNPKKSFADTFEFPDYWMFAMADEWKVRIADTRFVRDLCRAISSSDDRPIGQMIPRVCALFR